MSYTTSDTAVDEYRERTFGYKKAKRVEIAHCDNFSGDVVAQWRAHCNRAPGHKGPHRNGKLEWRSKK